MARRDITPQQIVAVIHYMNSKLNSLSPSEQMALASELASINSELCYEEKISPETWQRHGFPFDSPQTVTEIGCLAYLDYILEKCDEAPSWKGSNAKKVLEDWQLQLIEAIFSDVAHLAPQPSNAYYYYPGYRVGWLRELGRAIQYNFEYLAAKDIV